MARKEPAPVACNDRFEIVRFLDIDSQPVVEAGTLQLFAGCAEPKGFDEGETCARTGAGPNNIPSIRWDLGLK